MTSYASANDSNNTTTTTATMATTTPMSAAAGVIHDAAAATLLLTSPQQPPSTTTILNATSSIATSPLERNKLTANTTSSAMQPAHHNNEYCYDYDCDSLSDGHEKTDTTPENIKKIDDVIEQQQRSSLVAEYNNDEEEDVERAAGAAMQYHHTRLLTANSPTGSTTSTSTPHVGLAVALDFDDSTQNAKYRFAKSPSLFSSQQKDTLSKTNEHSEESHNDDDNSSSTNNNGNSNNNRSIDEYNSNSSNNKYSNSNNNSLSDNNEIKMDNKMLFTTSVGSSEPTTMTTTSNDDDSTTSNTTTATTKQSYSFTIDHFNDKDSDPAATAAKYKNMLERFQSRHRRGASMSKLESEVANANKDEAMRETLTSSASAAPLTSTALRNSRNTTNAETAAAESADTVPKVKLRARDRSTSRVRDASKRHSWSPRSSSTQEQLSTAQQTSAHHQQQHHHTQKPLPPTGATTTSVAARRSAGTKTKPPPLQMPKGAANLVANRTQFTPRSTAMQMALQKVDFLCPQPPLTDFKHLSTSEADNVSEAGTYTLDGDNYTEEQKEVMNIDMSGGRRHRPKDLQLHANASDAEAIINASKIPVHRTSNVLEVNYYHEADEKQQQHQQPRYGKPTGGNDLIMGSHQSAGAYLEKIKSRVLRNMSATKNASVVAAAAECDISANKYLSGNGGGVGGGGGGSGNGSQKGGGGVSATTTEEEDMGCFTSVTTSGVLAKQGALDPRPKLTRKSSLSTSQIDSSEYISNEMKLKNPNASAYAAGGFTDHQKAEYRLNLFTNQKDSQKFAATRSFIESPPETPTTPKLSDTAVLKTAQTKNDWIQEWARNARARSLANETKGRHPSAVNHEHTQDLMTRSYTCSDTGGNDGNSLTDDSIYSKQWAAEQLNKSLAERYRLAGGECDYSSDPMLSCMTYVKSNPQDSICKPPKSPSKIPSPMHSLGRARSASRTRASLQNMLPGDEDGDGSDIYLQKTAAAINNLQQTLSRKNSLKSPTHSASPRAHSARVGSHAIYSPEDCSPQHSLGSPTALNAAYQHHRSPMHQQQHRHHNDAFTRTTHAQHLQLMTSSFNEQQLALLTSGEYLARQMRMRKNSFDGGISNSPARRVVHNAQAQTPREQESLSPLRRSSSFSAKIATQQRAARPQYQNIYTPPPARQNYTALVGGGDGVHQYRQQQQPHQNASNNAAAIKKSASSNNFRQVYSDYDDNLQYYINDEDDMGAEEYYSSGGEEDDNYYKDDFEDEDMHTNENVNVGGGGGGSNVGVPLSNTRYNKALLMRIERSKQKVAGGGVGGGVGKINSAPPAIMKTAAAGLVACPNTPELPRRGIKSAPRAGAGSGTARQSMPRDVSLSRLATQVPNSLASAKKQLLQTAAAGVPTAATRSSSTSAASNQRVQPKYLDISKYKPAQGNNFLRKNDSKSTLKQPTDAMKRSPSSSSMGLSRTDATRMSNRSVRSVTSCMTTSGTSLGGSGRASSAARRDASIAKQKEAEMAMWKRRSTYDPMKAAAEDRRKKEEAKRLALAKSGGGGGEVPCESSTRNNTNQQISLEEDQWALDESEYGEDDEDGDCV